MSKYGEIFMQVGRQALGLDPEDTSRDEEVEQYLSRGEKMSKSSTAEIDKESFWRN